MKRLFIDGLGGFERAAVHRDRLLEFFATLTNKLRSLGVTTMATWETREILAPEVHAPFGQVSAVLDNLVLLRQFEENHELRRSISIQKMRESVFDFAPRQYAFAQDGFKIDEGQRVNAKGSAASATAAS